MKLTSADESTIQTKSIQRTWCNKDAPRTQELGHSGEIVSFRSGADVHAIKADHCFAILGRNEEAITVDDLWMRSCRSLGVGALRFLGAPRFQSILTMSNYIAVNFNTFHSVVRKDTRYIRNSDLDVRTDVLP